MMTTEQLTTTQIMREDKEVIEQRFGKPMYRAIHKALTALKDSCIHPESSRRYCQALIPLEWGGITPESETRTVVGFYCQTCRTTVLPDPEAA